MKKFWSHYTKPWKQSAEFKILLCLTILKYCTVSSIYGNYNLFFCFESNFRKNFPPLLQRHDEIETCPIAETFNGPLLSCVAEVSASWQQHCTAPALPSKRCEGGGSKAAPQGGPLSGTASHRATAAAAPTTRHCRTPVAAHRSHSGAWKSEVRIIY